MKTREESRVSREVKLSMDAFKAEQKARARLHGSVTAAYEDESIDLAIDMKTLVNRGGRITCRWKLNGLPHAELEIFKTLVRAKS